MRLLVSLTVLVAVLAVVAPADGRCRRLVRHRWCHTVYHCAPVHYQHSPVQKGTPIQKSPVQKDSPLQKEAQRRANDLSIRGYGGHFFAIPAGATGEGWGWGATPEQALNNCCVVGRVCVAQAWASCGRGYFAIRFWR